MGNENERKHSPAENRQEWLGPESDLTKTGGGGETNVDQTDAGAGGGGMSAGSGGVIGGSADFLTDEPAPQPVSEGPLGNQQMSESGNQQNVTGQQGGDSSFGGQSGAGSSALASNSGQSDLGSAGVGERNDYTDVEGTSQLSAERSQEASSSDIEGTSGLGGSTEGVEGSDGSDGYLQPDALNPELAREDSLDQGDDAGMGLSSGQGQP